MRIISSKLIISRTIMVSLLAPIFLLSASFSIDPTKIYRTSLYDPIEQIVTESIKEHQFPGCQVLVLHHGKVILNKAYGHLTYDSLTEVTTETLYDVASLTKVMATTLMVLDLVDQKLIRLDDPISCYLEEYAGTNKEKITTRQLLAHNGQLKSYIPLWEKTFQSSFCEEVSHGA
ncbi:MAG: serine hydrolase domain-containing protein [Cyclobacteriaceae bacterium]